jgi:hypothetical protein
MESGAPAHLEFRFSVYYPSVFPPASTLVPTVYVFPTASFAPYKWDIVAQTLRSVLRRQPDLSKLSSLPMLPPIPAGQAIRAQAAYLAFHSGRGICYLAYYASDVSLPTPNRMIYAFQGVTSDGKYYVSAVFPVHVAFLPTTAPANIDYPNGYYKYVNALVKKLDAPAAASAITPRVSWLNATMSSISVVG